VCAVCATLRIRTAECERVGNCAQTAEAKRETILLPLEQALCISRTAALCRVHACSTMKASARYRLATWRGEAQPRVRS
jgi:hypothetical protein